MKPFVLLAALALTGAAPQFGVGTIRHIADVSSAVISPDGARIAFVVSRVNWDANRKDDQLQVYDRNTRAFSVPAPGRTSVDALAWSPDSLTLAAVMDDQLFLIGGSGSIRQLTHGKDGVDAFAWAPGGGRIAFVRRDPAPSYSGARAFHDAIRVGDNAYLVTKTVRPEHLWIVSLDGREQRLTHGAWSVSGGPVSWSPDGQELLYLRAPDPFYGTQDRAAAMRVNVRTLRSRAATPFHQFEDTALFSPDGRHVAYRYSRDGTGINESEAMIDSRDVSRVLDRQVEELAWMPDSSSLLLRVFEKTQAPLYLQPLHGAPRRLPLGPVREASIDTAQSVAHDGTIVFTGTQMQHPAEVYVLRPGARSPEQVTHFNDPIAALHLARETRVAWTFEGFHEDGVLTYPPDYKPGKKYPMVLRIHGGPALSSMTSFDPFYQAAASRGYLVFAPNYRGSNDLGNAYQRAIFNDASAGPGRDVMAGIAAVERLGIVDEKRIGVSGWSYGGQMTSWMESHYHIWRAAVAGAAVNDLVVDYAIADDIDADSIAFTGGSPYKGDALAQWRDASPMTYFKNIRTPTLILCNIYDVRVPIVESYEMYRALRDNHVPVEFYAYPSTGHLPNGPVRLADAYSRWLDWFDRYLH